MTTEDQLDIDLARSIMVKWPSVTSGISIPSTVAENGASESKFLLEQIAADLRPVIAESQRPYRVAALAVESYRCLAEAAFERALMHLEHSDRMEKANELRSEYAEMKAALRAMHTPGGEGEGRT